MPGSVGREASCAARVNGVATKGKALLETDEVVLPAKPRLRVPLRDLARVEATGDELLLAWPGGEAALALGAKEAATWAEAIRNPRTRAQKLGVKPGGRVSLLGVTDDALAGELAALGADVATRARKESDAVFVQVDDAGDLAARLAKAKASIAPHGALWVITPRGAPGLKDTDVMRAGKAAGLVDVKVVRFSGTHTANKLVVPVADRK